MRHEFQLNTSAEREWRRLQPHFELSDYFILGFIFSDNGAATSLLLDRLAAMHRCQISGLQSPRAESPQDLLEEVLPLLVRGSVRQEALRAPIWLDLSALKPTPAWRRARLDLLARLNERREQMRKHLTVPLVLVLPLSEKRQIRELVPDLWAIRNFAVDVGDWLEPLQPLEPLPPLQPLQPLEPLPALQPLQPLEPLLALQPLPALEQNPVTTPAIKLASELTPSMVREWRRLQQRGSTERGVLLAAGRAIDALLGDGDHQQAAAIAEEALQISRSRLQLLGETPLALLDLSVSLVKLGDAVSTQGQLAYAQEHYCESLDICRKLLELSGEDPEALRSLVVALEKVGSVFSAQNQWQCAQEYYSESLELSYRLLQQLGETPKMLRDLSVSLEKVGDIAKAQGQWQRAQEFYSDSLAKRRRLLEHLGKTAEALRDLSVSLDRVGDVACAQGNWQRAQELYSESLELRRDLLQRLGKTTDVLRYLVIAFERVSGVAIAQGQQQHALELLVEGLGVASELAERFPNVDEYQEFASIFKQRLAHLQQ